MIPAASTSCAPRTEPPSLTFSRPAGIARAAVPLDAQGPRAAALDIGVVEGLRRLESRIGKSVLPDMCQILARHVRAGRQRMREAIAAGDAEALQRAAHKLKSSARCLGLLRLSETCAELERLAIDGDLAGSESLLPAVEDDYRRGAAALDELLTC